MLHKTKYVLLGVFVTALGLWGLAVTIPNTFSSGEVVSAAKMNQNFQALKDAVDALEAKVATLESANADLGSKLAAVATGDLALPSESGVLGYAMVDGTTDPPTVSQSFNSNGGAVTVQKTGTGRYKVIFDGLTVTGGVAFVTPYLTVGTYCTPGYVGGGFAGADDTVTLGCREFNNALTYQDTDFFVLVVK